MGLFSRKEPVDRKQELKTGFKTKIILPNVETVNRTIVTMGTGGTLRRKQNVVKHNVLFRVAEKGLVLEKCGVDGSDVRLPWEDLKSVERQRNGFVYIDLLDGRLFKANFGGFDGVSRFEALLSLCEPYIKDNVVDSGRNGIGRFKRTSV